MGALPSRESQEKGLHSHRHGRNRRSEILLIPLTSVFFPSYDCPLFQHLYNARNRRTAKYYFRALRSTEQSRQSDYFCTTVRINDPAEFEKFDKERQQRQEAPPLSKAMGLDASSCIPAEEVDTDFSPKQGAAEVVEGGEGGEGASARDYDYESYTDTLEGLYQVLIADNDLCMCDTDEELRDAYLKQVQRQRAEWGRMMLACQGNPSGAVFAPPAKSFSTQDHSFTGAYASQSSTEGQEQTAGVANALSPSFTASSFPLGFENLPYDVFISGFVAARQYIRGKRLHTHHCDTKSVSKKVDRERGENGYRPDIGETSFKRDDTNARKTVSHVTSPTAYYLHPIPCAIVSRWDEKKSLPADDPHYVLFEGFYVKVMGMFGLFPATVPMRYRGRYEAGADPQGRFTKAGTQPVYPKRTYPRKEGFPNSDDGLDDEVDTVQHLLKGTMFVDKDVGDQILGNMIMLATHMYVQQCIQARIQPRYIPMLPYFMRFPLSNIPMLQLVREFRVRLRTLLEAGTAKSGQKPMHVGMSGVSPEDIGAMHDPKQLREEEEGYLFEPDIPDVIDPQRLFIDPDSLAVSFFMQRRSSINTNVNGRIPILMMSGFNVQSSSMRHALLNDTGYHMKRQQKQDSGSTFQPLQSFSPSFLNSREEKGGGGDSQQQSAPALPSAAALKDARLALLLRRKNRFRIWIEDGHMCIWASAAYARRACLILAQQLNTTVDSPAVPDQRSWNYRGLLYGGMQVPVPERTNDVLVVAEDMISVGLWQGDVLRCCTHAEKRAMHANQPLPLPCTGGEPASPTSHSGSHSADPISSIPGSIQDTGNSLCPVYSNASVSAASSPPANTLLYEQTLAPPGSFWVRCSGGLDDSYTNISECNIPPNPKMEKQLQQAAQQRSKKMAVALAAHNWYQGASGKKGGPSATGPSSASDFLEIDRREGTLNLEEVILSWMRVVFMQTRDIGDDLQKLVLTPGGYPVRIDRYAFHRFEYEGSRYFIGVTTRFTGQQRRIEKMLNAVYAMEGRQKKSQCGAAQQLKGKEGSKGGRLVQHSTDDSHIGFALSTEPCVVESLSEDVFESTILATTAVQHHNDDDLDSLDQFNYDKYLITDD